MPSFQVPVYGDVHIPTWVVDLDSFRRWVHSGVLPEKLKIHFINGEVWTDFYMEDMISHNRVKAALGKTLAVLIEDMDEAGIYVPDGMLLTNDDTGLAASPDAMFVSNRTLERKLVKFVSGERAETQATEMVGSPDLAIEIVSPSSEAKDTERLMSAYHDAGIREYWLIDARDRPPRFDIYKRGPKGYSQARAADGWVKSPVLGHSFRFTRAKGRHGLPTYRLEHR